MSVGTVKGGVGLNDETVPGAALFFVCLDLAAFGLFLARSFSIFCLIPSSRLLCLFLDSDRPYSAVLLLPLLLLLLLLFSGLGIEEGRGLPNADVGLPAEREDAGRCMSCVGRCFRGCRCRCRPWTLATTDP